MQPLLFFVRLKTVLLLIIKRLIVLCKTANLTVFPKQNPIPRIFFNENLDSQVEGNSLHFCVFIHLLLCVFGQGGWIKAVIKSIIDLAWKFTPKLK